MIFTKYYSYLQIKHQTAYIPACVCLKYPVIGSSYRLLIHAVFIQVYQKIGLNEYLVIQTINLCICMVMSHQIAYPVNGLPVCSQFFQKFFRACQM